MITERIRDFFSQFKIAGLLQHVSFPITKQELMEFAEEHNAPERVIEILDRLPEKAFDSLSDVLENLRGQPASG